MSPGSGSPGVLWQWQDAYRQADAQNAGNAYAHSIEMSDGGKPETPLTPAMLMTAIDLTVAWSKETGNPIRLVENVNQAGIGYHAQFPQWAPDGRSCPGPVRIQQLKQIIIPAAARKAAQFLRLRRSLGLATEMVIP